MKKDITMNCFFILSRLVTNHVINYTFSSNKERLIFPTYHTLHEIYAKERKEKKSNEI